MLSGCGIRVEVIEKLKNEGLIQLFSDETNPGLPELEKIGVHEITNSGVTWLVIYRSQEKARQQTLPGQFASGWRSKLVELVWGLGGLTAGTILGWFLRGYFG